MSLEGLGPPRHPGGQGLAKPVVLKSKKPVVLNGGFEGCCRAVW